MHVLDFNHISVLLNECLENLNIIPNGIYVDGTLGGAGHSKEICKRLLKDGLLIGIDQDETALSYAKVVLKPYEENVLFIHDNFSNIKNILIDNNIDVIDGMILDLGVSSYQLDEATRGFSYMNDANLDMRMNSTSPLSAFEVVNTYNEKSLSSIIKEYGEERWAKRIAEFIIEERKKAPIETTFQLVSVIKKAIPKGARADGPHPAKRTFQAIRIEVNNELNILKETVYDIVHRLKSGGRLCIITFHSLEDRIIKNTFKEIENPCTCPIDFPICVCNKKPQVKIITRKPIVPLKEEVEANHRSRSAKLRVIEKL